MINAKNIWGEQKRGVALLAADIVPAAAFALPSIAFCPFAAHSDWPLPAARGWIRQTGGAQ